MPSLQYEVQVKRAPPSRRDCLTPCTLYCCTWYIVPGMIRMLPGTHLLYIRGPWAVPFSLRQYVYVRTDEYCSAGGGTAVLLLWYWHSWFCIIYGILVHSYPHIHRVEKCTMPCVRLVRTPYKRRESTSIGDAETYSYAR